MFGLFVVIFPFPRSLLEDAHVYLNELKSGGLKLTLEPSNPNESLVIVFAPRNPREFPEPIRASLDDAGFILI